MKALNDNIIVDVKVSTIDEKIVNGIIIPGFKKEETQIGIVISAGPGKLSSTGKRISLGIEKDDKVIFRKEIGTKLVVDSKKYLTIKEIDVIGIIR